MPPNRKTRNERLFIFGQGHLCAEQGERKQVGFEEKKEKKKVSFGSPAKTKKKTTTKVRVVA